TTDVFNAQKGALKGLFSVSSVKQVRFSQGNLQYSTSGSHLCADGTTQVGTWRFADNQYDYVGSRSQYGQYNNDAKGNVAENDNAYIGSNYEGWIDLLGWGTSGYHDERDVNCANYYPYSNSMIATDVETNKYGYGPSFNLADKNLTASNAYYDWGVYNAISNGGNEVGAWRTLTADEWNYLCNGRPDASSKWGYATVNGVKGVVVLPDKWILPHSCTFAPGKTNMWATNSYTQSQWEDMEALGALFLPAAGLRYESMSVNVGNHASYWSSSAFSGSDAYGVDFSNVSNFSYNTYRFNGLSVRLVSE
ncbi:MAG: hypothetical protein KBT04_04290, partial [Bacteroidales bacterium]|nr:hypothetical protein [Candidatus Colimorpha onthohippi]